MGFAAAPASLAAANTPTVIRPVSPLPWGEMAYDDVHYLPANQTDEATTAAPLGEGAHYFHTGDDSTIVELYRSTVLDGTALTDLSTLSYTTLAQNDSTDGVLKQPVYLRLTIDVDGAGSGTDTASLFYQPAHNGTVLNDTWQTWNTTDPSAQWSDGGSYSQSKTLDELKVAYPQATIVRSSDPAALAGSGMGGLAFIVGAAGDNQTNSTFGLDNVTVNNTTHDLEPVATGTGPGTGGGGDATAPVPPAAPEGTTDAEGASSSDPNGTATATSGQTTVTAVGVGAFTVAQYPDNPTDQVSPLGQPVHFDVLTAEGSKFSVLTVEQCGLAPETRSIVWFDGHQWVKASPVTFEDGCATLTITDDSSPNLSQLTGTVFAAGELPVTRLAGADRIATAVAVSQAEFKTDRSADAVVLARADLYPDALAGAPLAAERRAPLLLTGSDSIAADTLVEIQRVAPADATVYLLGGPGALSSDIASELEDAGFATERIAGGNRYSTAIAIADELGNPGTLFEVPGNGFADALSAGPAASKVGAAILLTKGREQAGATESYLTRHPKVTRYAIGGLSAMADPGAERIAGANRYTTSAKVAHRFFEAPGAVSLATGQDFPDALAGGPMNDGPILLVRGDSSDLPKAGAAYLRAASLTALHLKALGGTDVLTADVVEQARSLLQ